jgi:WXG100 family type VII secretion target
MADDLIRMNFATTAEAAASIANCRSVMDNEVTDLHARLSGLQESWEGDARQAYGRAMLDWGEAAKDLNEVLFRASQAVDECTAIMLASETRVAGFWNGGRP